MKNSVKTIFRSFFLLIFIGILPGVCTNVLATQTDRTEENTDIILNPQTITEKHYENNGLTGIYNVDLFAPDEDNIFRLKESAANQYYESIVHSLFDNGNTVPHTEPVDLAVAELNLFSKVNYHTDITSAGDGDSYLSYIYAGVILAMACAAGFCVQKFGAKKSVERKERNMYITITLRIKNCDYTIQIDRRQKIYIALETLKKSGQCFLEVFPVYYKSLQMQKIVSAYYTFQEANIYTGDIMQAMIS